VKIIKKITWIPKTIHLPRFFNPFLHLTALSYPFCYAQGVPHQSKGSPLHVIYLIKSILINYIISNSLVLSSNIFWKFTSVKTLIEWVLERFSERKHPGLSVWKNKREIFAHSVSHQNVLDCWTSSFVSFGKNYLLRFHKIS
jgi:hypothetical protein